MLIRCLGWCSYPAGSEPQALSAGVATKIVVQHLLPEERGVLLFGLYVRAVYRGHLVMYSARVSGDQIFLVSLQALPSGVHS